MKSKFAQLLYDHTDEDRDYHYQITNLRCPKCNSKLTKETEYGQTIRLFCKNCAYEEYK